MLVYPGRVSLYCFLAPSLSVLALLYGWFGCHSCYYIPPLTICLVFSYFVFLFVVILKLFSGYILEVAIRGLLLGTVFWCGVNSVLLIEGSFALFGWYLCLLSFFHWSEFMAIAWANPVSLNVDSYILNHSREYKMAVLASWIEFFLEFFFLSGIKQFSWVSWTGLIMCVCGEIVRKSAMLTAAQNFTHLIQFNKGKHSKLITSGVYSVSRHPSYVGWFYWSIGTQLVILNPLCFICYAMASWKFFNERIVEEELTLLNFFGEEYVDYQRKVGTGLPFIKGYRVE